MQERRARLPELAILAILAAIVAGIYGQTLTFDYVFDDQGYLLSRPVVREGLSVEAVRWAFWTWEFGNWFPLTRLSWLADVELFGMDPGPAHLINALVHLANASCMFLFLEKATGWRRFSAAIAVLWVAHPLNVEVVAWITERSLLLATFFLWCTLGAYLAYVRRPGAGSYLLAVLGAVLGFLAKPILIALPVLLLLLDWWPLGRWRRGAEASAERRLLLAEKLPFVVLAAAFGAKAVETQTAVGSVAPMGALSLSDRVLGALRGVSWYVDKAAFPSDLGVYYPLSLETVPWWKTVVAAAVLALITVAAIRSWRACPQALAGWLWFALTLVPVAGLVQAGAQSSADRYAYLPLFGVLLLAAGFLAGGRRGPRRPRLLGAATVLAVALLSVAAFAQARFWRDELTLFGRALAVAGTESPLIRNRLAEASERAGDFRAAVRHHQVALRFRPDWALTYRGLGRVLARQGDFDAAERHLREAVRTDPEDAEAREDLDDFLRCRAEPANTAACLDRTIVARADNKWR